MKKLNLQRNHFIYIQDNVFYSKYIFLHVSYLRYLVPLQIKWESVEGREKQSKPDGTK